MQQLSEQEQLWIRTKQITRLTDQQEVLIYPMGAERYLSHVLFTQPQDRYPIIKDVQDKQVLIIPGYGNSSFLMAKAGAKSVTVYDKDPVTIAWVKAYKKFYHFKQFDKNGNPYPSVGELLEALTSWYPPLISLPSGRLKHAILWLLNPVALRRAYIHYMIELVQLALNTKDAQQYELDKNIQFYTGELSHLLKDQPLQQFDTAFIPYLLGVKNGIESADDIVQFITDLSTLVPSGSILITPSQDLKEMPIRGQRYFSTTGFPSLIAIPGLAQYLKQEDKSWFKTQGLVVLSCKSLVSGIFLQ